MVKHEHKELGQITEWIVEKFRGEKTRKFKYVLAESLFELVDDEVADSDDKNIQIIDLVNVGFFEPLTDFCAHFFCMKDILISQFQGKSFGI